MKYKYYLYKDGKYYREIKSQRQIIDIVGCNVKKIRESFNLVTQIEGTDGARWTVVKETYDDLFAEEWTRVCEDLKLKLGVK